MFSQGPISAVGASNMAGGTVTKSRGGIPSAERSMSQEIKFKLFLDNR